MVRKVLKILCLFVSTIHERYGGTDGQTDVNRMTACIGRACIASCGKNTALEV